MSLEPPTLHTARLRLRPLGHSDEDALFRLHSNLEVVRYWDAPAWTDRANATGFINKVHRMADEGTGIRLAVELGSDQTFIGWCSLDDWNPDFRSVGLGYSYVVAAWGYGYATEAARALLLWGFENLDLNRVQAETDTRNPASAHVLEKLGFIREGTLREDCIVNGEISDTWVFGLLRKDWFAAQG
ncbi:MAG: GNAT family N-acetyltransferase [Actinobacteria bacterium]|nr:GNAT family N-acetyltransferase [Actinomycetota bacterium]